MRLRNYYIMSATALCTTMRSAAAFAPASLSRRLVGGRVGGAGAAAAAVRPPPLPSRHTGPSSPSLSSSSSSSSSSSLRYRTWSSSSSPPSSSSPLFSSSSTTEHEEEIDPGIVEGTNLRVLKYPHPSLRAPNLEIPIEDLTGPGSEISKLAKEMFLVMYAARGVGLAAPQIGVNKCLMVYNESGDPKDWMGETVMVNPRIVEYSEGTDVEQEGCLSFPKIRGDVERSKWIKVEAMNLKGKVFKKKFKGWEARIFQHEYDHLDGKVFVDRLSPEGRGEAQPSLDGLIADFGEGGAI